MLPYIKQVQRAGITNLKGIAAELNASDIRAAKGGKWWATQVRRVLECMEDLPVLRRELLASAAPRTA